MSIEITSFRKYNKGTLQGFFNCKLTSVGLTIKDCMLHKKDNTRWVGLPSRPYEDNGATKYAYIVKFDKDRWTQFQKAALRALDEYIAEHRSKDKPVQDNGDDISF